MTQKPSTIPKFASYEEEAAFWDTHDLGEFWQQTEAAEFEVDIQSEITYYAVAPTLARRLQTLAQQQGISGETPLNLWVQEKMVEAAAD